MRASRFNVTGHACCLAGVVALAGAAPAFATDVAIEGSTLRLRYRQLDRFVRDTPHDKTGSDTCPGP